MARAVLLAMLLVLGVDAVRAETLESSGVGCIKRGEEVRAVARFVTAGLLGVSPET